MRELISSEKLVKAPEVGESTSIWADYCELQCLVSDGYMIDEDQIGSIVLKSSDFSEVSERRQKNRKDRLTTIFKDAFSQVLLRKNLLGDKYPFRIDSDDQLCLNSDALTNLNKLYLLLLCASNLCYMHSINGLTSDFEVLCLLYMRSLFPSMTFKLFGSSNINTHLCGDDIIKDSQLKDRLVSLSKFIAVTCNENNINKLSPHDVGDGGLDLVGIRSMGDERTSIPVIFGQCACSPEQWSDKQHSISGSRWSKYLETWETSFQRYMFIPIWLMNSEKKFEDELKIEECVIVDRLRLMNIADESFITKCSCVK